MDQLELNVRKQQELCHERRSTRSALVTDIGRVTTHITSAIGAAIVGCTDLDALLRDAEGTCSACAERRGRQAGPDRLRIRRHAPDLARGNRSRRSGDAHCRRRASRSTGAPVRARARPETAQAMHDETLATTTSRRPSLLDVPGPKYCRMHNFKDVDWTPCAKR